MFSFMIWAALATQQQAREAMEPKYSIPKPVVEQPVNISRDPRAEPTVPVSKPKR